MKRYHSMKSIILHKFIIHALNKQHVEPDRDVKKVKEKSVAEKSLTWVVDMNSKVVAKELPNIICPVKTPNRN